MWSGTYADSIPAWAPGVGNAGKVLTTNYSPGLILDPTVIASHPMSQACQYTPGRLPAMPKE